MVEKCEMSCSSSSILCCQDIEYLYRCMRNILIAIPLYIKYSVPVLLYTYTVLCLKILYYDVVISSVF